MSDRLRRLVATLVVFGLALVAAALVFGAVLFVLAILAPIGGFGFFVVEARLARSLWLSRGRFEFQGGMRLLGDARTKALGATVLARGVGGLAISLAPTWFVFGPATAIIPSLAIGLSAIVGATIARGRLLAGAKPIDVLPPE